MVSHFYWDDAHPRPDEAPLPHPRLVARCWRAVDDWLSQLLAALGPGLTVVLVSDHGMRQEPFAGMEAWHDLEHATLMVWRPGVIRAGFEGHADLLDVVPTLLRLLGAPPQPQHQGRVLEEVFLPPGGGSTPRRGS